MTTTARRPVRNAEVVAMWDDDVRDVGEVPADKIRAALEKAREAFWQSFAANFPEVKTGDMAPGDELAMEWGTNYAAVAWLTYNHPTVTWDDPEEDDDDED